MVLKHNMTFSVEDEDPNRLGEFLRSITFIGEGFGCYENFDVREDAREWSDEERLVFVREFNPGLEKDEYVFPRCHGYTYGKDGLLIDVFWYWDGDGDLTFRIRSEDGTELRSIGNSDCKSDRGWNG